MFADMNTGVQYPTASTYSTSRGGGVPASYMNPIGRSLKNGAFCHEGATGVFNTSGSQRVSATAFNMNRCGSGNYSSQGVVWLYNGNTYNAYFTFRSPEVFDGQFDGGGGSF